MIDPQQVQQLLDGVGMPGWAEVIDSQLAAWLRQAHGNLARWQEAIAQLPDLPVSRLVLDRGLIEVGAKPDSNREQRARLERSLRELHPWRKGPFLLHGVFVDTEWRSDWKWDRLAPHISPLHGRRVLDVGCGNGYHCWRMAGSGARLVIGIDPTDLYLMQFQAVHKLIAAGSTELAGRVLQLPLGIEQLPPGLQSFDTVFSMGVLYHRRSPLDHLLELRGALRPGGELVLETLVIEGDAQQLLVPAGRYAKMRNVWFIPSVAMLTLWLQRCGYTRVRCVDVTPTSLEEQRSTDWMQFESLADFLDPVDRARTIEGYPAPRRAILLAQA